MRPNQPIEAVERGVTLRLGDVALPGLMMIPPETSSLVVFAHGSGSSRLSPRNRLVASHLNDEGMATLLFDLLTDEEALDRRNVFDIGLLAERLAGATRWLALQPATRSMRVGYFGASTGAAAALRSAGEFGGAVRAVVSRGGRPDLAGEHLTFVTAPTLLIVGGNDDLVLELNQRALERLTCEAALSVVPGATHLFEEPGALEQVAERACDWFHRHLGGSR